MKKTKDDEITHYSFGYRYYYWEYYRRNLDVIDRNLRYCVIGEDYEQDNKNTTLSQWYIPEKYINLKNELLNNTLCVISVLQWELHCQKADHYMKTMTVKCIKCQKLSTNFDPSSMYGIAISQPISSNHLVAVMVYCNQDVLQARFTETYRKISNEETDECIKKRHQNYHHLGRLLREVVECFGYQNDGNDAEGAFNKGHLYHGITIQHSFDAINTRIYGPTSTTTEFAVAAHFSANSGMIVELRLSHWSWYYKKSSTMAYFDCHWLSDYPSEQERFFVGGFGTFSIVNIFLPNGTEYLMYCKAMVELCTFRVIRNLVRLDSYLEKIMFCLLAHELHRHYHDDKNYDEFTWIPQYIADLMHTQCQSVTRINFTNKINMWSHFQRKLFDLYFFYDYGWLKLDVLTAVFPSLRQVILMLGGPGAAVVPYDNVYLSILEFLRITFKPTLQRIVFWCDSRKQNTTDLAKQAIDKYNSRFKKYQWRMELDEQTVGGKGVTLAIESAYKDNVAGGILNYIARTGQ
eukprot:419982_1